MNKQELKRELNLDRKKSPYEPKSEEEARELAEIGIKYGLEEPEDLLSSNYVVRQFLEEKYGKKVRAEEQEEEIAKELEENEKLKSYVPELSDESLDKLKRGVHNLEYQELVSKSLGLTTDPTKKKEAIQKYAKQLRIEDEEEKIEQETDEWWKEKGEQETKDLIQSLKESGKWGNFPKQ